MFSAKGDLGEGLFVQRRFSVHLRGQGGDEGWGISQSFSSDRIYLRICQAPCPVMNLNDPDTENCFFHSSLFFVYDTIQLVGIRHPLVVVAGGKAVSPKGDFAF